MHRFKEIHIKATVVDILQIQVHVSLLQEDKDENVRKGKLAHS